jgi:hypothetical protein
MWGVLRRGLARLTALTTSDETSDEIEELDL